MPQWSEIGMRYSYDDTDGRVLQPNSTRSADECGLNTVGSVRMQISFRDISDFYQFILFHILLVFFLLIIPTSLAPSEKMFNQTEQMVEALCQQY